MLPFYVDGILAQEQKQLNANLEAIETELSRTGDDEQNVQKLKTLLDGYMTIEPLTANILNQLIERIEIGHAIKVNGCSHQEINIFYRFVGALD